MLWPKRVVGTVPLHARIESAGWEGSLHGLSPDTQRQSKDMWLGLGKLVVLKCPKEDKLFRMMDMDGAEQTWTIITTYCALQMDSVVQS